MASQNNNAARAVPVNLPELNKGDTRDLVASRVGMKGSTYEHAAAELAEIDENLIRNELTQLEQAVHLARRKELYLLIHPETAQGAKGGWYNNKTEKLETESDSVSSFVDSTANLTGVTDRTIYKKIQIGEALANYVDDLIDTPIADRLKTFRHVICTVPVLYPRSIAQHRAFVF